MTFKSWIKKNQTWTDVNTLVNKLLFMELFDILILLPIASGIFLTMYSSRWWLRLCHPPWVSGSSWGEHLEHQGWVRELVGRALVGQVQEEAPEVGASCQDGVEGYLDKGEHNNKI